MHSACPKRMSTSLLQNMSYRNSSFSRGSSFISRLDRAIGRSLTTNFNLRQCVIQCFSVSGGRPTAYALRANQGRLRKISSFQPTILILQIGGNDLNDPNRRPEPVAYGIVELMVGLRSCPSVRFGIVCELFVRHDHGLYHHKFMNKRHLVNRITTFLQATSHEHLMFWRHL